MTVIQPSYQGGTPKQRWDSFLLESQMRPKPPHAYSEETINLIKEKLQTVNPNTGFLWGCKEIADELKICRRIVSKVSMEQRRKQNKKI